MPRWVLVPAVVAGLSSFAGGALVGAHSHAGASPPGLVRSTASSHTVQPQPPAGSCHATGFGLYSLPDSGSTPGAIDPAVTQANIASLRSYGDHHPLHAYEYDHLVSLELGGAPNDPRNLWPEPGASPNPKDSLEDRLHARVCDHQMTLASAQRAIAQNWVAAYHRIG